MKGNKDTGEIMTNISRVLCRLVSVAVFTFMCAGCWKIVESIQSSALSTDKMYQGPLKPRDEIAVMVKDESQDTYVIEFDGRKDQETFLGIVYEMLPGPHVLCVTLYQSTGYTKTTSEGCVELEFIAESGHTYELYAVEHTHKNKWYPAVWDITDELKCAQKKSVAEKIESMLANSREESGDPGAGEMVVAPKKTPPCRVGEGDLPGSGEELAASIDGRGEKKVAVEYDFERYQPFVRADGDDGETYHLALSPLTGEVEKVLGTTAVMGNFMSGKRFGFQPLGSDMAYVTHPEQGMTSVYREVAQGKYELVKREEGIPPLEEEAVQEEAVQNEVPDK